MASSPDPYQTLGVARSATDAELRAAYRRLVQLHHPDHNGGSAQSARAFEEVQEAYAAARRLRAAGGGTSGAGASGAGASGAGANSYGPNSAGASPADPGLDARLAAMEQELKAARAARDRAARAARQATEQTIRDVREMAGDRASDEALGYYSTDDSLSKILDDAASELSDRLSEARDSPAGHRVSDLIDELAAKLAGEHPKRK
jgi:DnaJ-like protein